jgi:hypothetical protein
MSHRHHRLSPPPHVNEGCLLPASVQGTENGEEKSRVAIRFHQSSMRSPRGVCWRLPWRRPVQLVRPVYAGARPAWPHRVWHPHPLLHQPGCPMFGPSRRSHRVLSAGLHHDNAIKSQRNAHSEIPFHWRSRQRGLVEAPGVELGSENRQHTGMGIITQPRLWSAQAQVRGGLPGRERFGHQFLR